MLNPNLFTDFYVSILESRFNSKNSRNFIQHLVLAYTTNFSLLKVVDSSIDFDRPKLKCPITNLPITPIETLIKNYNESANQLSTNFDSIDEHTKAKLLNPLYLDFDSIPINYLVSLKSQFSDVPISKFGLSCLLEFKAKQIASNDPYFVRFAS